MRWLSNGHLQGGLGDTLGDTSKQSLPPFTSADVTIVAIPNLYRFQAESIWEMLAANSMSGEHNHSEQISPPDATNSGGGDVDSAVVCRPAGKLEPLRTASWRFWLPLATVVFAVSAGLLFFRLGQYPLWVDEADTALYAKSIARTGDTLAMIDHNLYAYGNGGCLKNLHGRYQPPLAYYCAAPFVGANGNGSFWPRVPFAICGLLSVVLMLYWMSKSRLSAFPGSCSRWLVRKRFVLSVLSAVPILRAGDLAVAGDRLLLSPLEWTQCGN